MEVTDRPSAREGAACGSPSDLCAIAPSQARGDLDDGHKSSAIQRCPSADLWLGRTSTVHRSLADSTVGPDTFASDSASQTGTRRKPRWCLCMDEVRVGKDTWLRFPTCAGAGASSQPDRSSAQRPHELQRKNQVGRLHPSRIVRNRPTYIRAAEDQRGPQQRAGALVLDGAVSELATGVST